MARSVDAAPHRPRPDRVRRVLALVGACIALVGGTVTVVHLFQPWRSCPYDDSPAACSMLPGDAAVMLTAMCAVLVGLLLVGGAAVSWIRQHR